MLGSVLTLHSSVQILLDPSSPLPPRDDVWWNFTLGRSCAFFSGDLQRKIQRVLANFWQERFISLRTVDAPCARDLLLRPGFHLESAYHVETEAFACTDPRRLSDALNLAGLSEELLDRELTRLSNGELRRLLIARMWMENPELWILDDPFGGLDAHFRHHLALHISRLALEGVSMVVFLRRPDERLDGIPAFRMMGGEVVPWPKDGEFTSAALVTEFSERPYGDRYAQVQLRSPVISCDDVLFGLESVRVDFGGKTVLGPLDWVVRRGEHWAILGPNGAGKSTLLGLLTADHPQIYRNRISLLGHRPGEGLSIWEHRERIGFFSPELALHYHEDLSLWETVSSGYGATLGLVAPPTPDERRHAREILAELGFGDRCEMGFGYLENDEKRLVLIARALVRPPEVLILDEPTQGMDVRHRDTLFALLDRIAEQTSLLMVTHYLGEWPRCITHVLQL